MFEDKRQVSDLPTNPAKTTLYFRANDRVGRALRSRQRRPPRKAEEIAELKVRISRHPQFALITPPSPYRQGYCESDGCELRENEWKQRRVPSPRESDIGTRSDKCTKAMELRRGRKIKVF